MWIKGFPYYEITMEGEIYSLKTFKWLIPQLCQRYLYINLRKDNKTHFCRIHRLVAKTFIPNPDNLPCVNHKDGDRLNNRVDNLEWCTHQENINHAMKNNLHCYGTKNGASKLTEKEVKEIREMKGLLYQKDIAAAYGVSKDLIWKIQNNYNWKHI